MKKNITIYILTTALIYSSCGSSENKNAETIEQITSNNTPNIVTDFTKTFEGAIDGKHGIIMTLTKNANNLNGSYTYKRQGTPIKIFGTTDDNGNLTINEFNDKGNMTGIFKGQLSGNNIIGQWTKPDGSKSMPFSISESTNGETTFAKTETSITSNKATCSEKESKNDDGGDPILTKTCLYRVYKTISKGYPDYKGRYSYEYSVFKKKQDGSYVQTKNALLFNENKNELLSIINSKIEKEYQSYSNDPETKDCFEDASFTPFKFDQLGIYFDEDKINFNVTFGLSGACMSVDGTIVSFKLDEIQKYLNE
jgi:hypothetical protein